MAQKIGASVSEKCFKPAKSPRKRLLRWLQVYRTNIAQISTQTFVRVVIIRLYLFSIPWEGGKL